MLPRPLLSRRTTLVTGLGASALAAVTGAGCSVQVPGAASAETSASPGPGGLSPDVRTVVELVGALQRSVALLEDTRTQHPKLAAQVAPLLAVQRRHLAVLRKAAPTGSLPTGGPGSPAVAVRVSRALAHVVQTTEALRDTCYAAAGAAESGQFARLLASMGAGLAQQLVVVKSAR